MIAEQETLLNIFSVLDFIATRECFLEGLFNWIRREYTFHAGVSASVLNVEVHSHT